MLLTADTSFEFMRFMQILVWIILPLFLTAVTLTVFLHYRKKKRQRLTQQEAEDNFVLAAPEQFSHHKSDGEYVFFDHSGLIREYKSRMFYNHARYTALRKDYALLQSKFSSLTGTVPLLNHKNENHYMKNQQEQVVSNDEQLPADQLIQQKELADKLQQLNKAYQRLEEENRFLQEQISLQTAGDGERDKIVDRWKEENKSLREKLAGLEYLDELLEEKKEQISFLQNQLEHRIKNQHQAEQQRQQAIAEKEEQERMRQELSEEKEALKNELALKQDQADHLQAMLAGKEEQFEEEQQALNTHLDQITYLQNVLQETKEQNELLNAEVADRKDEIANLQQLLSDERSRVQFVEQKLNANRQLLQRLYKEFTLCLQDEIQSPVVTLKPSYIQGL
jgi:chromosome segregation ATPase